MVIADLCKDTYRLCDLLHTHKIQFICTHCISQGFLVSSDHNFVGFRTDFKDECRVSQSQSKPFPLPHRIMARP